VRLRRVWGLYIFDELRCECIGIGVGKLGALGFLDLCISMY